MFYPPSCLHRFGRRMFPILMMCISALLFSACEKTIAQGSPKSDLSQGPMFDYLVKDINHSIDIHNMIKNRVCPNSRYRFFAFELERCTQSRRDPISKALNKLQAWLDKVCTRFSEIADIPITGPQPTLRSKLKELGQLCAELLDEANDLFAELSAISQANPPHPQSKCHDCYKYVDETYFHFVNLIESYINYALNSQHMLQTNPPNADLVIKKPGWAIILRKLVTR